MVSDKNNVCMSSLFNLRVIAPSVFKGSPYNQTQSARIAPTAITMVFLSNLFYATTRRAIMFLMPEIFPPEMRAQGNGSGVTGWAIGVGWTTLINPIRFRHIKGRAYLRASIYSGCLSFVFPYVDNVLSIFFGYSLTLHSSAINAICNTLSPLHFKTEAY
jgi:hypothetical protein